MKLSYTLATPEVADTNILALRGKLEENIPFLARLGYDGLELMVRDIEQLSASKILALSQENGLEIAAVSSGQIAFEDGLYMGSRETGIADACVQRLKEIIDFCEEVKAPIMNVGTVRGNLPPETEARALSNQIARESMKEVVNYGASKKITIALEPQCRYVVNWHNTLADTSSWMEGMESPYFKILLDVYHTLIEEDSLLASLIRYHEKVAHIQFSDTNRLAPGQGHMAYPDIIRVLRALGYHAYVSVEVKQHPTGQEAARRAIEYLRPLLKEKDII